MASDGSKPKANPIVGKIVKDPKSPPNALCLRGFVGDSSEDKSIRLYFDPNFSDYVDVPQTAILHSEPVPEAWSPFGAMYVWIERDAELMHGSERIKANFMQGRIFQQQAVAQQQAPAPQAPFAGGGFPGGPGGFQFTPPPPPITPITPCPTQPLQDCPPSRFGPCITPPPQFCPPPPPPTPFFPCPTDLRIDCPPSPGIVCQSPPPQFCPPTPPQNCQSPFFPCFTPPVVCQGFPGGITPVVQPQPFAAQPFAAQAQVDPRAAQMAQAQPAAAAAPGFGGAQDFRITPIRSPFFPCITQNDPFCPTQFRPFCPTQHDPICPTNFSPFCQPFPLGNTPAVQPQPFAGQPQFDPRMAQAQPAAAAVQPGLQQPGGPVIGFPPSPPWFHCPPRTLDIRDCFQTLMPPCTAFPPFCGFTGRPPLC